MLEGSSKLLVNMQVEVWSDVVCPWCYIGKRRLESALEKFPHRDQVEVVWRSFQLDPSVPEGETHPTLPALAAKYGTSVEQMRANMTHVEQTAAGEGLEYHLADAVSGNTLLAHELLLQILERAWADANPLVTVPAAEGCEDGTCAV
jgi:predicted DsbA family dithiol-disulfide isomerase